MTNRRRHALRRRELLVGGAALGAFALSGCGRDQRALGDPFSGEPPPSRFPLGAASGDVTHDSAVLWTKYAGAGPVSVEVFRVAYNPDTGELTEVPHHTAQVTPADGGFVHARVEGLRPGEVYRFELSEGDDAEAQFVRGTFRAAPAPDALEPLRFTASSCSKNGRDFGTLLQAAAIHADLHILLGDTTYNDGSKTRDQYRARWAENLGTSAYRRLRASRSVLATWDDHEISNDWAGAEMDPVLIEHGVATFFEHTPMRRNDAAPDRVWRNVRWGQTAEFFIMDGRSERVPSTRDTANAEYISRDQLEWLKTSLRSSTARFKILVNSVPIGRFPGVFGSWTHDQWVGYGAQRDEVLAFIEESHIGGAFFLSGDFHMGCIGAVSMDGPGSTLTEVLSGASATGAGNPFWDYCKPPQFGFATVTENVTSLELDPLSGEVRVAWIADDGRAIARRSFRP